MIGARVAPWRGRRPPAVRIVVDIHERQSGIACGRRREAGAFGVEEDHGSLADPDQPLGNGVLLWFEVTDFDAAVERARATGAPIVHDVHTNPNARHRELWIRDPDGLVVLASPSDYRPRA